MIKKYVWTSLLILAIIFGAVACGGAATQAPQPEQTEAAQQPAQPAQETNKLRVGIYAYMTNGIPFDDEVAACMESHPELDIEVLPIPGEESAWQAIEGCDTPRNDGVRGARTA